MTAQHIIKILQTPTMRRYLEKKGIKHLSLVGSFSRNQETSKSDIDLIYETQSDSIFSMFDHVDVRNYLKRKLGYNIDMTTPDAINFRVKKQLLKDKIIIF